jgi:hypothetical protein
MVSTPEAVSNHASALHHLVKSPVKQGPRTASVGFPHKERDWRG